MDNLNNLIKEKQPLIMVVDDQYKNLQVIANILKEENFDISLLAEPKNVYEMVLNLKPILILLDIMMPEMDGFQVCEQIKSNPEIANIPIIFLTAKDDSESIAKGFEIGAVDYIVKPFSKLELLARVNTHIKMFQQQSEIEKSKKSLEEINQNLEEKVKERTGELQKAAEKLAKLDRAKTDFLNLISHEIKTPLTSIMGYSELLKNNLTEQIYLEYIDSLIFSTKRLEEFSQAALLFTSLSAEGYKMNYEIFKVKPLFFDLSTVFENVMKEKNITINTVFSSNFFVHADRLLLSKLFEIVLDNAIKFSSNNSEIKVNAQVTNFGKHFEIIDKGKGFPEYILSGDLDKLSSKNIAKHSEGFGLGLATAKLIITLHNGKVEFENREDGGVVHIYIPR